MDFKELVKNRRSHRSFISDKPVPKELLEELLTRAALSPTSLNQQGWKVLVVMDPAQKQKMYDEACHQQQVLDSSAVLIICGNEEQYKQLPEITGKTETMAEEVRKAIIANGEKEYGSKPGFARDEAIRSATFFSMSFMFAATNEGLATGPMIGFKPDKLCTAFGIESPYFPVLLISVGYQKDPPFPRGYRRPVKDFAKFI